jgi:heterogeneous nuclear ribonucleoprotein G
VNPNSKHPFVFPYVKQIITERDTGRPRGFGFVTYTDWSAVEAAIAEMNNVELDGRIISVNRAEPKPSTDESYGYHGRTAPRGGGFHDNVARGLPGGRDRDQDRDHDRDECFKCGHSGHWARDCPSSNAGGGGGRGGRYTPPSARYSGGGVSRGTREDRFGGRPERYSADRFFDDR